MYSRAVYEIRPQLVLATAMGSLESGEHWRERRVEARDSMFEIRDKREERPQREARELHREREGENKEEEESQSLFKRRPTKRRDV